MRITYIGALTSFIAAASIAACSGPEERSTSVDAAITAGLSSTETPAEDPRDPPLTATADQSERWIENWCSVRRGQTRTEAISLMGEPTGEWGVADNATPQLNWEMGPYSFTAFMDTDAVVNGFYANYEGLGEADRSRLTCPEDRP